VFFHVSPNFLRISWTWFQLLIFSPYGHTFHFDENIAQLFPRVFLY
jgi:hypothetical protein